MKAVNILGALVLTVIWWCAAFVVFMGMVMGGEGHTEAEVAQMAPHRDQVILWAFLIAVGLTILTWFLALRHDRAESE